MSDYIDNERDKLIAEMNKFLENKNKQKQKIQEAELQQLGQEAIASKKLEILQKIDEELKKMSREYDTSEKLAYYLRKEYFDQIPPNSENSLIIIANQQGDKWAFHVQQSPESIDLTKIKKIDIIMKD